MKTETVYILLAEFNVDNKPTRLVQGVYSTQKLALDHAKKKKFKNYTVEPKVLRD